MRPQMAATHHETAGMLSGVQAAQLRHGEVGMTLPPAPPVFWCPGSGRKGIAIWDKPDRVADLKAVQCPLIFKSHGPHTWVARTGEGQ